MRLMSALKAILSPCIKISLPPLFSCWLYEFSGATPILPPNYLTPMSSRMKTLAHAGHLALYFMLIALPVTGCLYSWSLGYPAPVLYLFKLPALIAENPAVTAIAKPLHIWLSWAVGLLLTGHIAAALKHHFIDKDHVLTSMMRQSKSSKK